MATESVGSAVATHGEFRYQRALNVPSGKLAMLLFMSTEVMFFTALLASYVVLRFSNNTPWPSQETMHVELWCGIVNTIILVSSSFTLLLSLRNAEQELAGKAKFWLLATLVLALAFLAIKGYEYSTKLSHGYYPTSDGSLIYDATDESYLSRTVSETRAAIQRAEQSGVAEDRLQRLYQLQKGVVDWTQSKVGDTNDLLTKKAAMEALGYLVKPQSVNPLIEEYLSDEANEVSVEQSRLSKELDDAESSLESVQAKLKALLALRESGDREIQQQYQDVSKQAERLTEKINEVTSLLGPIEARLAFVGDDGITRNGINEEFEVQLPMVIPNGKSWINTYFLLTGFHLIHLLLGVVVMVCWSLVRFSRSRAHWLENFSIYWHFVDVVWLVIFAIVYFT